MRELTMEEIDFVCGGENPAPTCEVKDDVQRCSCPEGYTPGPIPNGDDRIIITCARIE